MPRYASMLGGERERVVGVALGLLRLTLRDRHAGARRQRQHRYQPVVAATASSAQRRAATRSPPASAACAPKALHRRHSRQGHSCAAGRLARVSRAVATSPAARAAAAQHRVADARGAPPSSAAASTAASAAARAAPVSPWHASAMPGIARPFASRSHREPPRPRPPDRANCATAPARSPCIICAIPRHQRHTRETNRSPIASARSRPSSAAARTAIGSPAMAAACACQARIWLSLHRRPTPGPARSPRRSMPGPPRRWS